MEYQNNLIKKEVPLFETLNEGLDLPFIINYNILNDYITFYLYFYKESNDSISTYLKAIQVKRFDSGDEWFNIYLGMKLKKDKNWMVLKKLEEVSKESLYKEYFANLIHKSEQLGELSINEKTFKNNLPKIILDDVLKPFFLNIFPAKILWELIEIQEEKKELADVISSLNNDFADRHYKFY